MGPQESIKHRPDLPPGIESAVRAAGGRVSMADFMDLALTHATEGYYTRSRGVLGARGDFSTAPSLCPTFNAAVARLVTELLDAALTAGASVDPPPAMCRGSLGDSAVGNREIRGVIELGGGEGQLAAAILQAWDSTRRDLLPAVGYRTVEIGDGLRSRQEAALAEWIDRGWDVRWGRSVDEACRGTRPAVVVGNEFFDALPVHLVDVRGPEALEVGVAPTPGPKEVLLPLSGPAERELEAAFGTVKAAHLRGLTRDGIIELRPAVATILESIARRMPAGSLIVIDYGDWHERPPFAGRPRGRGALRERTLRGYFRHQRISDPLARVGRQDLTADVDFGTLVLHADRAGFEVVVFTTLSGFLLGAGAEQVLADLDLQTDSVEGDPLEADRQGAILRGLLDPAGPGGNFKVMVMVREEGGGPTVRAAAGGSPGGACL